MRATILLCDYAQVANGKLYILGGGWSVTSVPLPPSAIAVKLEVPWDQADAPLEVRLALVDTDGTPIMDQNPAGPQPIRVTAHLDVRRLPGLAPGTPLDAVLAVGLPPLPLDAGGRYTWQLEIDGDSQEDWHLDFSVRR